MKQIYLYIHSWSISWVHTKFSSFKILLLKSTAFLPNTYIPNSSLNRQTKSSSDIPNHGYGHSSLFDAKVGIYFLDYT